MGRERRQPLWHGARMLHRPRSPLWKLLRQARAAVELRGRSFPIMLIYITLAFDEASGSLRWTDVSSTKRWARPWSLRLCHEARLQLPIRDQTSSWFGLAAACGGPRP